MEKKLLEDGTCHEDLSMPARANIKTHASMSASPEPGNSVPSSIGQEIINNIKISLINDQAFLHNLVAKLLLVLSICA